MTFVVTPVHDLLLRGSDEIPVGLYQLQLATCEQLTRLHYSPGSYKAVQKRLKALGDAGFVQVDGIPIKHRVGNRVTFSPLYYYTLGPKGMHYLDLAGLDTHGAWRASKEIDKHALFIEHTIELNDVLVAAALLHKADPSYHMHGFEHERVLKRQPIKVKVDGQTIAVIPDAFMLFVRTGTQLGLRVLLEHDRGTEEQYHFKQKIRAHIEALRTGMFAARFGEGDYTVAFTTFVSEQRVQQMRQWTEQVLDETKVKSDIGEAFNFALLPRDVTPEQAWLEKRWHLAYAKSLMPYSLLAA